MRCCAAKKKSIGDDFTVIARSQSATEKINRPLDSKKEKSKKYLIDVQHLAWPETVISAPRPPVLHSTQSRFRIGVATQFGKKCTRRLSGRTEHLKQIQLQHAITCDASKETTSKRRGK